MIILYIFFDNFHSTFFGGSKECLIYLEGEFNRTIEKRKKEDPYETLFKQYYEKK